MPDIKRPMELAGLRSRLLRAQLTEAAIGETGKRFDKVLNEIDELHSSAKLHAGDLENYKGDLASTINRMVGGSNGGDPLDESDGQDSSGNGTAKAVVEDTVRAASAPDSVTAAGTERPLRVAASTEDFGVAGTEEPLRAAASKQDAGQGPSDKAYRAPEIG